jgi:hypothetical protein
VEAAAIIGIEFQAFECVSADLGGIFHSTARALRQRGFAKGPGEGEMSFGVVRIERERTSGILFAGRKQCSSPGFVRCVGSDIYG